MARPAATGKTLAVASTATASEAAIGSGPQGSQKSAVDEEVKHGDGGGPGHQSPDDIAPGVFDLSGNIGHFIPAPKSEHHQDEGQIQSSPGWRAGRHGDGPAGH